MAITIGIGTSTRKVIQVAVSSGNDVEDSYIVALCDDGTMWRLAYKVNMVWERIDAVPTTT